MQEQLFSCGKINFTLRVTGKREDGYHSLVTSFFRIGPLETLTIREIKHHNVQNPDVLRVHNVVVPEENILFRVLREARKAMPDLPALEMDLWKQIPPGSGLGTGSGNAAALVRWLRDRKGVAFGGSLARIGADVPFLAGDARCARGEGVGEVLIPLPDLSGCAVVLLLPRWRCDTRDMFRELDVLCGTPSSEGSWLDEEAAREELDLLCGRLRKHERVGLLPNDFLAPLRRRHPEYERFFAAAEATGSFAWGVSGSGSTAFALFPAREATKGLCACVEAWAWVHTLIVLEE
jgi:4-diphosphocytidyl-2-C-methyl-D-erythritol kinase